MKRMLVFFLTGLCSLTLLCCKNAGGEKQKSTDLITIKTLGLAYLEEFKHEEAEQQFLRFIELAPEEKLGYANLGLVYLRVGKYPEAEKQLLKGIEIDPKDPDIRLLLATVYQMEGESDKAISQLAEALKFAPDHIKSLYSLTEIYATKTDEASQKLREESMQKLAEKTPGNLVPILNLTDIYIRQGNYDKALEQLENVRKQFPEFPKEAGDYYDKTIRLLRKSDKDNAIIQFTIFHNYLKVTSPYQAGIVDLKGPGGALIGFPLITFDQQSQTQLVENESLLEVIKFTDVTASAGLDLIPASPSEGAAAPHVETGDYDGDGDIDLYAGGFDAASSSYRHFLFNNDMGRFRDVSGQAGIRHSGQEIIACYADYDNDGFPDLYIVGENGDLVYRNNGKGSFEDVTASTRIKSKGGSIPLFFDLDHDGDLDLFKGGPNSNLLYRNNTDGTFTEQAAKMGLSGNNIAGKRDAAFGDFDEDGDIDMVVADGTRLVLYSNQREGIFRDATGGSGLEKETASAVVAVADYNNDGFLDLFTASAKGTPALYSNNRNGTFAQEKQDALPSPGKITVHDATFFDFDNDGFLDLMIAGEQEGGGRGLFLYHNDGKGKFTDVSSLLPEEPRAGRQISVFDYNDDGDLDMVIAGIDHGIFLLRNDGGNNNHYIKVKLVGLTAGSAKNNHFGIGAKVEMRAGELYQTLVVTDPNVHFGIGNRRQADVIRITWTNGVPQNMFFPATDQALIEAQTLKGSCPFLYTWNGDAYVFTKDILWRSALGMPLGIMGGNRAYAFADASDDYIKIPGEMLKPKKGSYSVQLTSELWETIYFDKLQLVAVDHPDSLDVYVAEQFSPPPFPGLRIYQVGEKHLPVSVMDGEGNNLLALIKEKDDQYISGFKPGKFQGVTEMHHLILDPGPAGRSGKLILFLNGWIFPTDASINAAISQSGSLKVQSPVIQVLNKRGEWVTVIDNMGFPMGKDKTVVVDISGKFQTDDHRIRITTNMEIYWDQIFFSAGTENAPMVSTPMAPASADLHYRGFSNSYRKGGRYGPHWFDYNSVDKDTRWRDLTGSYTRYGNVLPLLIESDNKYIISNAGDETTVEFSARNLPELKKGWKRDFLIRSVGWVKDGDLNTAFGNTVMPLPFHGMKSYPPGPEDIYPATPDLQRYHREYNTRTVTAEGYLNAVKGGM